MPFTMASTRSCENDSYTDWAARARDMSSWIWVSLVKPVSWTQWLMFLSLNSTYLEGIEDSRKRGRSTRSTTQNTGSTSLCLDRFSVIIQLILKVLGKHKGTKESRRATG